MLQDGLDAGREGSLFALAAVSKVGVTGKAGKVGAELEDYLWSLEDPPGLGVLFVMCLIGPMTQMNFKLSCTGWDSIE